MKYLKRGKERLKSINNNISEEVANIIDEVIKRGDEAVFDYSQQFDRSDLKKFRVDKKTIEQAYQNVDMKLIEDIKVAAQNIEKFAIEQKKSMTEINDFQTMPGVFLGQKIIPVQSCGTYVPGGSYPLFSTALMLIIPAKVAGVKRIVACSPIDLDSQMIDPITLIAMDIAGADEIYACGGVQAIAALTYGTNQIKSVDLIVGPGNQYVSEAKRQCYGQVGIDFVAGPSEVLIISDDSSNPALIAADILAQSEHDEQAKGILITTSSKLADEVIDEVEKQLSELVTVEIARKAWNDNGEIIIVDDLMEACQIANDIAPEHLEVQVIDSNLIVDNLINYGSLFINKNSAEVFGDYVVGTNHTLPTARAARYTGGVYVGTFLKVCTYQYLTKEGIDSVAPITYRLAMAEGLEGHANAAKIRMEKENLND